MRAVRFHAAGDIRVDEVPAPPAPGPGEVLLKVATAGICGSDGLEYAKGPSLIRPLDVPHPVTGHLGPLTLGHEFAGEVVAVGDGVEDLRPGMLVACGAGMSCGTCPPCRAGRTNLCTTYATIGFHADGALAEHVLAPADICFDAGAYGLGPDAAALAQPMAIAVHAARRGRVAADELVLIIGAGGIGSFLTFAAVSAGADRGRRRHRPGPAGDRRRARRRAHGRGRRNRRSRTRSSARPTSSSSPPGRRPGSTRRSGSPRAAGASSPSACRRRRPRSTWRA